MYSLLISLVFLACTTGGIFAGFWFRKLLPEHHVNPESKDTVKLATGLIATLSALVLGLLVASAKSSFDAVGDGLTQQAARIIYLDRVLVSYGPDSAGVRVELHKVLLGAIDTIWPEKDSRDATLDRIQSAKGTELMVDAVRKLTPVTDDQRAIKSEALQVSQDVARARWLIFLEAQNPLPIAFMLGLLFWLTALHCGFGLLSARNITVIAALCVSAIAVSGTVFLILEMGRPLTGYIKVSSAPFEKALELTGQ